MYEKEHCIITNAKICPFQVINDGLCSACRLPDENYKETKEIKQLKKEISELKETKEKLEKEIETLTTSKDIKIKPPIRKSALKYIQSDCADYFLCDGVICHDRILNEL